MPVECRYWWYGCADSTDGNVDTGRAVAVGITAILASLDPPLYKWISASRAVSTYRMSRRLYLYHREGCSGTSLAGSHGDGEAQRAEVSGGLSRLCTSHQLRKIAASVISPTIPTDNTFSHQ